MAGGILAPIFMGGPIWGIVLGVRLWRSGAEVFGALRRTHWLFLAIDVLLVAYGIFALRAAERSAAHGGGLLGAVGLIPLGLGIVMACFSGVTLLVVRAARDQRRDETLAHKRNQDCLRR